MMVVVGKALQPVLQILCEVEQKSCFTRITDAPEEAGSAASRRCETATPEDWLR